jgi:hypothetical protein
MTQFTCRNNKNRINCLIKSIVDLVYSQVGISDWRCMTRVYGPVWSTDRAPAGALQFRAVVTGGYDGKWVWAEQEVLPADWQPGQVYDTGVRIADVARDGCQGCDMLDWK